MRMSWRWRWQIDTICGSLGGKGDDCITDRGIVGDAAMELARASGLAFDLAHQIDVRRPVIALLCFSRFAKVSAPRR